MKLYGVKNKVSHLHSETFANVRDPFQNNTAHIKCSKRYLWAEKVQYFPKTGGNSKLSCEDYKNGQSYGELKKHTSLKHAPLWNDWWEK
jgi:hypothetical protein